MGSTEKEKTFDELAEIHLKTINDDFEYVKASTKILFKEWLEQKKQYPYHPMIQEFINRLLKELSSK